MSDQFINCVIQQLKEAGFGKKRSDDLVKRFDGLREGYKFEGLDEASAGAKAQERLFSELKTEKLEKYRGKLIALQRYASGLKTLEEALASGKKATHFAWDGGNTRGAYAARALISISVDDPRFNRISCATLERQTMEDFFSQLGDGLRKYGKGIFAKQKGAADQRAFARAMYGDFTGAPDAVAFAKTFTDVIEGSIASLRRAGSAKNELTDFKMPDPMRNKYSLEKAKSNGTLLKIIKDNADFRAMRRPDGRPLPADGPELDKILMDAVDNKIYDGAGKEGNGFGGGGSAHHRFFKWKDGDAWMNIHEAFGDGTAFDVMYDFLRNRAKEIARMKVYGRNPEQTMKALVSEGRKRVKELGLTDLNQFNDVVKNRLEPIMRVQLGGAIPNPENRLALGFGVVANMTRAAMLQGAPLIAIPSDQVTSAFFRHLNHLGDWTGAFDMVRYAKLHPGEAAQWNADMGYVSDCLIEELAAHDRFSTFASLGPAWSKATTSAVMRAGGMAAATEGARRTFREGMLVNAVKWLGQEWEELPVAKTMARYGITKEDWDAARGVLSPVSPLNHPDVKTVNFTQLRGNDDLYTKFQSFIIQESYNAVPDSGLEAHVILTAGNKPDTLVGALGNSFSMFKNMSVYIPMLLARQIIAKEGTTLTRAKYTGAILAALTAAGAAKMQVQEVVMNGRTPRKTDAQFWSRAVMVGGGLGFMGDAVFGAADSIKGRGINDIIAGAAASTVGSAVNFGASGAIDLYKYAAGDISGDKLKSDVGHKATEFMRQNLPGTFYTKFLVNRYLFDSLDEMVDPVGYGKRQRQKESMARRQKGNEPLQFK